MVCVIATTKEDVVNVKDDTTQCCMRTGAVRRKVPGALLYKPLWKRTND